MSASARLSISIGIRCSGLAGEANPWRKALRLEASRPLLVLGPVLRLALARLAAICRSVAVRSLPFVACLSFLFIRFSGRMGDISGPPQTYRQSILFDCRKQQNCS